MKPISPPTDRNECFPIKQWREQRILASLPASDFDIGESPLRCSYENKKVFFLQRILSFANFNAARWKSRVSEGKDVCPASRKAISFRNICVRGYVGGDISRKAKIKMRPGAIEMDNKQQNSVTESCELKIY